MKLSELKTAWKQLDEKLSRQNALQFAQIKEQHLSTARSNLRPLFWGMALQVVFGLISVFVSAPFWIANLSTPLLWVSGLIVHAYGLLAMILGGRIMLKINRLDMSQPVLGIQKQIVDLKKSYIRSGWLIGLPWWVLWLPYTVVLSHSRYDAFSGRLPTSFITIAAVCTAGMLLTVLVVAWAQNPLRPKRAARTEALLAGVSLTKAQQSLDELLRFEQEDLQ